MDPSTEPEMSQAEQYATALRVMWSTAKRVCTFYNGGVELAELQSVGLRAITIGVERYDSSRGAFVPYIRQRLRWVMIGEVRKRARRRIDPTKTTPHVMASPFNDGVRRVCTTGGASDGPSYARSLVAGWSPQTAGMVQPGGDLAELVVCSDLDPERSLLRRDHLDALAALERALRRRGFFDQDN